MNGKTTEIKDPSVPSQEPKKFTFDFSYWSHDGFKERSDGYLEPTNPNYADQVGVCTDQVVVHGHCPCAFTLIRWVSTDQMHMSLTSWVYTDQIYVY